MRIQAVRHGRALICAVAGLGALALIACSEAALGPGDLAQVGVADAGPSVFEANAFERSAGEPERLVIFDRSVLPEGYRRCYVESREQKHLQIQRPYDRASFPRNIAPPNFRWEDRAGGLWMLILSAPGWAEPLRVVTNRKQWRPDAQTWEGIKAAGTGDWVEWEVRGCAFDNGRRVGEEVYRDESRFRVSPYPGDPVVVYRLVSPLFHGYKTPDIYYREIDSFRTLMFFPGKGAYCTNCHVFPTARLKDKSEISMAIAVRKSFEGLRMLGLFDFGTNSGRSLPINSVYMSYDKHGRKIVVTGAKELLSKDPITLETQEFHVLNANILVVDRKTLEVMPLQGACLPQYAELFPTWSPDSKVVVFARGDEIDQTRRGIPEAHYDLYSVPYNDGKGGTATPVPGASANGLSNFMPRFGPDGRWLVFTEAESCSLVEPTADLWILPAEGGAPARRLECNCDHAMDSHHSWSSNSRRPLFASKRDDGLFARLYMTEIDEEGHAAPPVELPTTEDLMMCYNVPEFVQAKLEFDPEVIFRETSVVDR